MWTDFNNYFTVTFLNEMRKKLINNLLPYLKCDAAKFKCSTVLLYRIVIQYKSYAELLFKVNIYRDVILSIMCLCILIYSITAGVQNNRHQHLCML